MDSDKEHLNEDNLDNIERSAGDPGARFTLDEIRAMRLSSFPTYIISEIIQHQARVSTVIDESGHPSPR